MSHFPFLKAPPNTYSSLTNPRLPYSSSMFHPHVIGINTPVSSLLLAAWPSVSAMLYRCARREIATWVVTEMMWKIRSLLPAAFLFLSLATRLFTSSLVSFLCKPSEPLLSSLSDAITFSSAHALISFSSSTSNVSLVVGVPSLRWYSTSTSLFPCELYQPFYRFALFLSLFPCLPPLRVWLVSLLSLPTCFIPLSKYSFDTSFHIPFFSTISFSFFVLLLYVACSSSPAVVLLDVHLACASLLALVASFVSSSHRFTALLHTINFFPSALLAVLLTNCSHPSIILTPALSIFLSFFVVHMLSNSSENRSAFLAISSWTYAVFCYVLQNFVYSPSVQFPTARYCENSRLLIVRIRQWFVSYVRCAYMYFRFLTTIFYDHKVKNGAVSPLCALSSPFWPWLFYSIVQGLHLVFKELQHLCPILVLCYFPMRERGVWRMMEKSTECARSAVMLDGEISNYVDVLQGVAQACTLSPNLFKVHTLMTW